MSGVTILSTSPAYEPFMAHPWIVLIIMILGVFTGVFLALKFDVGWPVILMVACPLIAGVAIGDLTAPDYCTYKVTIDETVKMSEFMERYDILDQDGLIYIVRDKEIEE